MELTKLIYIGRHGLRSPVVIPASYSHDWPGGKSQLTQQGADAQYAKGTAIRAADPEFFSRILSSPELIQVRTSNVWRTISSAYSLLCGVMGTSRPPLLSDLQGPDVVTALRRHGAIFRPLDRDVVYRAHFVDVSPGVGEIYKALLESAYRREAHYEKLIPVVSKFKSVWEFSPLHPVDYFGAFYLYDFLSSYRAHGKPLPQAFGGNVYAELEFIHHFFLYDLMFASEKVRRLANHFLCRDIIQTLTQDPKTPSFTLHSSHDTNIFSLTLALGYHIKTAPECSTGVTIRLYRSPVSGAQHVRLQLGSECTVLPEPRDIELHEFVKTLENESFPDGEEFGIRSGNAKFDFVRDYLNAPEDVAGGGGEESSLNKFKVA